MFTLNTEKNIQRPGDILGGISVVIRKDLKVGVKFFSSKSDFYVWCKFDKTFLTLRKIFMFALVIFPPRILKANHC